MVNQLPQGWKEEELGNLFDITSSKRVFMADWKRTGVPFYRAREIVKLSENGWVDNELFISEEMYNEYAKKYGIPKENDIMITAVGTLGCVYVVKKNDRFYFKDGNIIWLKNRDIINSQYVKYYFQSPFIKRQIFDNSGAVVGTYTIIKAKQTKIFYPTDKDEQDYIVKTLDAVAEMIKLRKETIQLTKDLIPAIFQEMFGDPITNPKGWDKKDLGDVCSKVTDGSHNPPKGINGGTFILLSSQNILNNSININSCRFVSEDDFIKENNRTKLSYGDILLTIVGTIGRSAIYKNQYENIIFQRSVAVLSPDNTFVNSEYLNAYIQTDFIQNVLQNKAHGVAQLGIYLKDLRKVEVLCPPLSLQDEFAKKVEQLQDEFAKKVEQINKYIVAQQEELEHFETLFQSLLQEAFTGVLTWKYPRKANND